LVTRIAHRTASIAVGLAALFSFGLAPANASIKEDAKKICLERYNVEKAGGTIPAGMPKEKYMRQCTTSIVRNAQIEAEMEAAAAAQGQGGQGGPALTDPSATPKLTTTKPASTAKTTTPAPSHN
jgi:hypothetical protein